MKCQAFIVDESLQQEAGEMHLFLIASVISQLLAGDILNLIVDDINVKKVN